MAPDGCVSPCQQQNRDRRTDNGRCSDDPIHHTTRCRFCRAAAVRRAFSQQWYADHFTSADYDDLVDKLTPAVRDVITDILAHRRSQQQRR